MYVTRRGLQKGLSEVHASKFVCPICGVLGGSSAVAEYHTMKPFSCAGLEGLAQRLNEVKARLQAKLAELSGKQDETIAAQKELARRLEEVGSDVTSTANQVKQVRYAFGGLL